MTGSGAGKGDTYRPVDQNKFEAGYLRAFGVNCPDCGGQGCPNCKGIGRVEKTNKNTPR